ncbi:AI-2E family transporter [Cryobacterium sp. CG_9.6]|uniref:AI-2E family transporter n=1 Tax=Cryobacterium sp. CG_9.6 TaxID=2760710 RepID=UPI002475D73D|nr:AI-2E family transporter [Cryobacterium sp. CG_9.6]MDH6236977.1 putative PurR-regulated permease PerM [Cryobacterium sp. CG_9.6]
MTYRRRVLRGRRPQTTPAAPVALAVGSVAQAPERNSVSYAQINAFKIGFLGGLGVLIALVLGGVVSQLGTVLVYIGIALFLALGLDPLVTWMSTRMRRGLAIGIVFGAVVLIFVGLLFAIVPVIVRQATNVIDNFPETVRDISRLDWVANFDQQFGGFLNISDLAQQAQNLLNADSLATLGGGLLAVGVGIASGLTGAAIVLILTLYFLASLSSIKKVVYRFVPRTQRETFIVISEQIVQAVGRYVVGQVSLAGVNGVLSFIFLSIIGAPLPLLLAFIAFLLSLIPLVGTLTGSILIVVVCLLASPLTGLVAAIYYVIYMQVEAYVLSPRIMNRAVAVPGSIVVIGAVAGGSIGGVLGALVAIPLAASAIIVIQKVIFPKQEGK